MACLRILTNLPARDITKMFWSSFLPVISDVVRLSSEKLICVVSPDSNLNIAGDTFSLAVVATLETSEWHANSLDHQEVVDQLGDYFNTFYYVPKTRIFMTVQKLQPNKKSLPQNNYNMINVK